MFISGYEILRRDRTRCAADGNTYGGVCFYVRSVINVLPRPDLSHDELENLCIEIRKPNSRPFLVATTWYRPPDSTVDKFDFFEKFIGKLDAENVEYHLLGNLNAVKWNLSKLTTKSGRLVRWDSSQRSAVSSGPSRRKQTSA